MLGLEYVEWQRAAQYNTVEAKLPAPKMWNLAAAAAAVPAVVYMNYFFSIFLPFFGVHTKQKGAIKMLDGKIIQIKLKLLDFGTRRYPCLVAIPSHTPATAK